MSTELAGEGERGIDGIQLRWLTYLLFRYLRFRLVAKYRMNIARDATKTIPSLEGAFSPFSISGELWYRNDEESRTSACCRHRRRRRCFCSCCCLVVWQKQKKAQGKRTTTSVDTVCIDLITQFLLHILMHQKIDQQREKEKKTKQR